MRTTHSNRSSWKIAVSLGFASMLALSACAATPDPTAVPAGSGSAGDVDAAAAAALPAKYADAGVINAATGIYPPMEMFDDNQKLTGFDVDLANALGAKLGVQVDMRQQQFDSIIPSLQSGKHDIIIAGLNDTQARQETLDFVDYFHAGFSILVMKGNPENITGVLDLCGKDVAVQKATVQAQILHSYDDQCASLGDGPIGVVELPLETDVQTAVRSGKAVADVVDSAVAAYAAQTAGGGTMFDMVRDPENPAGYNPVYTGIGVLKADAELSEALLLALKSVIADGSYQEILEKYDLGDYAVDAAGLNLGK
ncbi:transporter substrate-binding domain-containing protein [Cryobacterium psychrophilum]|uniref:Transporter substrate-binding domain-containing protein n=1 Tax=Cryobacterium psychrophilum TaxID=41988 RepID=A0A4Y8KRQ3_9MICO|nr:transporter substrate-binding domain-containing protein [Cryobacterium psychrophilum]TDW29820.1 amino acid ABC transporter substrate-binding protein (PAAT family) [Cryobacterium psychrophilum]TFD76791.1 transporter substrate-binding domain-containing protein [Cryobacterium psychrophilum]